MPEKPHEWGFAIHLIGPKLPRGLYMKQRPMGREVLSDILALFRKKLPTDATRATAQFRIPGYPTLTLLVAKIQSTAAVIQFTRSVKTRGDRIVSAQLPALAILLTGLDAKADDKAVVAAVQILMEAKLPVSLADLRSLEDLPRPVAIIIYRDGAARQDASIWMIFTAAARAFFEQFGIEGNPGDAKGMPVVDL